MVLSLWLVAVAVELVRGSYVSRPDVAVATTESCLGGLLWEFSVNLPETLAVWPQPAVWSSWACPCADDRQHPACDPEAPGLLSVVWQGGLVILLAAQPDHTTWSTCDSEPVTTSLWLYILTIMPL